MSKSAGRPVEFRPAEIARWRSHVQVTASCHIWMGAVGSDGYGRFSITRRGRQRMLTPHQVAALLQVGDIPAGATLLHDCDVRLCVSTQPGHVRIGSQSENMRQAAQRGRAVGPRPGPLDLRGVVGVAHALQGVLAAACPIAGPPELAALLAAAMADGDPRRHQLPLFAEPGCTPFALPHVEFLVDIFDIALVSGEVDGLVELLPLFDC